MRGTLIAVAFLAATVISGTGMDVLANDQKGSMRETMQRHPEMRKEMMQNPHHLLMMGYHRNLMTFGHMLEKVARQGDGHRDTTGPAAGRNYGVYATDA